MTWRRAHPVSTMCCARHEKCVRWSSSRETSSHVDPRSSKASGHGCRNASHHGRRARPSARPRATRSSCGRAACTGATCACSSGTARYHLDLFRGIDAVQVNGREFFGGAIAPGDRITIGEATITVVDAAPAMRPTPVGEMPAGDLAAPAARAGGRRRAAASGHRGRVPRPASCGVPALPGGALGRGPRDGADGFPRSRAAALGVGGRRVLGDRRIPAARLDVPGEPGAAAADGAGHPRRASASRARRASRAC